MSETLIMRWRAIHRWINGVFCNANHGARSWLKSHPSINRTNQTMHGERRRVCVLVGKPPVLLGICAGSLAITRWKNMLFQDFNPKNVHDIFGQVFISDVKYVAQMVIRPSFWGWSFVRGCKHPAMFPIWPPSELTCLQAFVCVPQFENHCFSWCGLILLKIFYFGLYVMFMTLWEFPKQKSDYHISWLM